MTTNTADGPSTSVGGVEDQLLQNGPPANVCVVCGDESDGLHFGRFTCRACAAFFRRTVSLKLQYTCKVSVWASVNVPPPFIICLNKFQREGNCEVDKAARNMCRACRYQKCLVQGMLTTAVQHTRDGIGRRSRSNHQRMRVFAPSCNNAAAGDAAQTLRGTSETVSSSSAAAAAQALIGMQQNQTQFLGPGYRSSTILLDQATTAATIRQLNAVTGGQCSTTTTSTFGPFPCQQQQQQQQQQHYTNDFGGAGVVLPPYIMGNFPNLQLGQQPPPLGGLINFGGHHGPLHMTAHQLQQQQQPCTSSAGAVEFKYLRSMLDGYHHFLALRKASYTLVDGFPLARRDNEDSPQSNFGTSKKICKIEAKLFDTFYCLFSNAERAFRTYKMFGAGDDRLLMPDGGHVRLSELQKFYENNSLVRGDPSQVAKVFENAMSYLVKTVVAHMRLIKLTETELVALFGMFIWSDSEAISQESLQTALQVRNDIIVDLHMHYRSLGLAEAEVTLKTTRFFSANVFMLIPKLHNSMRFLREDFSIASIFGMVANCNGPSGREDEEGEHPEVGLSVKQQQPEERQIDCEASTSASAQQDSNSGGEGTSSSTAGHVGKRELK
ncbi:Ligand-binding domain of nuclear hormone receptor [Globodera pallida]|nr:Ligand-binding domain of nuclear hormone receptor [Globodera pallida]